MTNLFSISSIFIVVTNSILGILLITKAQTRATKLWGYLCLVTLFWGVGGYKFSTALTKEESLFWWQIAYVCVIFAPVLYFHFALVFTSQKNKRALPVVYAVAVFFLILELFFKKDFFGELKYLFNQFYWIDWRSEKSFSFLLFYILFYWVILGYSFLLFIKRFKESSGRFRTQLTYMFLGSMFGWLGPEGVYLTSFGFNIYPYTNFFIAIYTFIIAFAIIRYHLLDIRVMLTSAGIFLTVYTMVLGLPFLVGYNTKSWALSTSFAVVLASMGPLIYRMLQKKAEDTLLAKQRRYQKVLLQAAEGMSREHDLPRLFKLIVYIVKKTVRIKFAAAFSYDFDAEGFVLRAVKDHHMVKEKAVVDEQSVLVTFMHERGHPFLAEEMPATSREMLKRALNLEFALVVPAMMESKMLGFLVLGEKQDKSHYSQDDINVFEILANQAALAIENCMFIAESKKAQERIFAAEKLAAIGGMADGVAHQVKNRLNHFSVASGEMQFEIEDFFKKNVSLVEQNPQLKNTLDYLSKIAESLVGNVKKTDQIIKGILNFARTEETATYFSEFPLQDIITASLDMLVVKHKLAQFPLDYAAGAHDIIYGVKAQLMEAVYNTLDNGYEAIQERMNSITDEQERFAFVPKIRFEHLDRGDKDVLIISDNGIGIKDEDKRKIFAPFFTTKSSYKSGSGIGAYVVKRMVEENHKGKIIFESEYLKGTRFVIELPKKPASQVKPAAPDAA